jgi:hypothetical protein
VFLAFALLLVCGEARAQTPRPRRTPGLEIAARTGFAAPVGELTANTDLSTVITGAIPVWVDAGYRTRRLFLGVYAAYAWGFMTQGRAAASAYIANETVPINWVKCDSLGQSCSGSDVKYGIHVQYHFAPDARLDPWIGYGVGAETLGVDVHGHPFGKSNLPEASSTYSFDTFSPALLEAGVDWELGWLWLGPFVTLDTSRFVSASLSNEGVSETETIHDPAFHAWLTLGVRGNCDIPFGSP